MKKRYWLGLGISALLLFLMLRSLELASVARTLGEASLGFLVPALTVYFAGVAVRTVRWAVLLSPVKPVRIRRLFVVMVVGFTANNLLPFRAGEAARAYLLWRRERLEPGATVATILVERIFDGMVLTGFLVVAGTLMPLEEWLRQLAWVAAAIFLVAVAGVVAVTVVPALVPRLARALLSPFPARLRDLGQRLLGTFVDGLATIRSWRETVAVLMLSIAAWLLEASMYYVLMLSFAFTPSSLAAVLGTAVANLGTMVPSSPGYVGTFDLPLTAVLTGSFGVDPAQAASFTLLVHAALIIPVSVLGVFFLWREGVSLRLLASRGAHGSSSAEARVPAGRS